MKKKLFLKGFTALMTLLFLGFSFLSNAQEVKKRLPDGTIIYKDGSIKKPTGEVVYKDGKTYPQTTTQRFPSRGVRQPDGSILYPDGRIKYPDGSVRYPDGRVVNPNSGNNTGKWNGKRLPPGQAKKMYGSKSAKDYAPGHNKNGKHDNHDDDDDDHNKKLKKNKSKAKNKGKH